MKNSRCAKGFFNRKHKWKEGEWDEKKAGKAMVLDEKEPNLWAHYKKKMVCSKCNKEYIEKEKTFEPGIMNSLNIFKKSGVFSLPNSKEIFIRKPGGGLTKIT